MGFNLTNQNDQYSIYLYSFISNYLKEDIIPMIHNTSLRQNCKFHTKCKISVYDKQEPSLATKGFHELHCRPVTFGLADFPGRYHQTGYGFNPVSIEDIVCFGFSWWRHQMEVFSTLLFFCAGNSLVTGEFPSQRPVARSFDIFFDVDIRPNKPLSKQLRRR